MRLGAEPGFLLDATGGQGSPLYWDYGSDEAVSPGRQRAKTKVLLPGTEPTPSTL